MTAATIEVVDAVQQLLESEGILQSIRAQLRASVLNALATNGAERKASKAVQFLSKDNGKESILCVLDLLAALNLKETLSVLEAEIGITSSSSKTQSEMDNLRLKLSIDSNVNELMICHLLTRHNESGNQILNQSADVSITESPNKGAKKSLIPVISKKVSPQTVLSFPSLQSKEIGDENMEEDYVKVTQQSQYMDPESRVSSSLNESKDDNDNSFAEEEKLAEFPSTKDLKVKDDDDRNHRNRNSDDERHDEKESEVARNEEEDGESLEETPEEEDNVDDEIEDAADSDSSVSFSANYGYVDEDDNKNEISENKKESPVTGKRIMPVPDLDESFENSSDSNMKKVEVEMTEDIESEGKNDDKDVIDKGDNVGVQRLKQNSISRSKQGWDVDTRDDEDDFMFSEEGEREMQNSTAENKTKSTTRASAFRAAKNIAGVTDNDFEETLDLHVEDKSSKSDFSGGARSSWGAEPTNSSKSAIGYDDDEHSEDNSVESMVESIADTDDEEERDNKGGKGNNQEAEEEEEEKNTGGSLFTSRNKSDLPQTKDISNSNFSYDNDGNSEEFDADADYSKDEGTYLSSQSGQLSEVEKKIADMERENSDLVKLRLGDGDIKNPKNAQIDNSALSNGAEEYSDGEFEQSEEVVSVASESIASDDIEAMELSVGGAGSDSDGSFSGLNSESSNKMNKNEIGTKSIWGKSSFGNSDKKKNLEDSDASMSISDSADVSLSMNETEGSKAFDADGYDLTTKAIPPSEKRARDRTSGW